MQIFILAQNFTPFSTRVQNSNTPLISEAMNESTFLAGNILSIIYSTTSRDNFRRFWITVIFGSLEKSCATGR
jgi:hypothetical protein